MLSHEQMRTIRPHFPLARGTPRVDDRRVLSGVIYIIGSGLPWTDLPPDYGPLTTVYSRFVRWTRLGVFGRILSILAAGGGSGRLLIDEACRNAAQRAPKTTRTP